MGLRHALEPDGLPDAGHRRIPDAAALVLLLAVGQNVIGKMVLHAHEQGVFVLQAVRDVEGEGKIAARVAANRRAVDPDLCDLVDRAEVQQHAAAHEALRQAEAAAVPQRRLLGEDLVDAGQQRLRREGDADGPVEGGGRFGGRGEIPQAVQIEIGVAPQRGAGIFLPRCVRHSAPARRPKIAECLHESGPFDDNLKLEIRN